MLKNLSASFSKYTLQFKQASGTSRGVLRKKSSYFIFLHQQNDPAIIGVGECGLLRGLSIDDRPDYQEKLQEVCSKINEYEYWLESGLRAFPSIHFGLEMALLDLQNQGSKILFPSDFTKGTQTIPINGLIWMGEMGFMFEQIEKKLKEGFRCIKMKIGAIDFKKEFDLLKSIRQRYDKNQIELRVDANGAFSYCDVIYILEQLAALDIHSIEQPIRQGNWKEMADLCKNTPVPIALDEELIGIFDKDQKEKLLDTVLPQYVIFKPSFIGGIKGTSEWLKLAEERSIGWWNTSALESNVGLNAIAQWTATLDTDMPQGLGTGGLYTNNIDSPLYLKGDRIGFDVEGTWGSISVVG